MRWCNSRVFFTRGWGVPSFPPKNFKDFGDSSRDWYKKWHTQAHTSQLLLQTEISRLKSALVSHFFITLKRIFSNNYAQNPAESPVNYILFWRFRGGGFLPIYTIIPVPLLVVSVKLKLLSVASIGDKSVTHIWTILSVSLTLTAAGIDTDTPTETNIICYDDYH